jgi:hypothetical protein
VSHRLTDERRQRIWLTCNQPKFAALPPGQIERLEELDVLRFCSKPRVSNDNPYPESLFRTV